MRGTAKRTTFLPLKTSSVVISVTPSAVLYLEVAAGSLSPTLIVIDFLLRAGRMEIAVWSACCLCETFDLPCRSTHGDN